MLRREKRREESEEEDEDEERKKRGIIKKKKGKRAWEKMRKLPDARIYMRFKRCECRLPEGPSKNFPF